MLFNSFAFLVFFIIVFSLYIFLNHKWQNRLLLAASWVFYGWWDWRFLLLMIFSTSVDFFCGMKIQEIDDIKRRKFFLLVSIFSNLAILGLFKYFNFFASSLQALFGGLGITIQPHFLRIVLPVGISFYTFQAMGYAIDVYRREIPATRKFQEFALFIAFFPQLVAGPIEKAKHLLPQISSPRELTPEKFSEGCYLIFWGLFQKMFIADSLARIVEPVFRAGAAYNGAAVLLALYAFAFQIFCDFAGYSNIARGLGKCLGFDIMINFNLPYFASNPRQFWQRWHISLSNWLRDNIYIPLGGNRQGALVTYRNLGITMFLGGLWHGASWTFVIWGIYQGALLIIYKLLEPLLSKIPSFKNRLAVNAWMFIRVVFFFHLICLGWLIFRAQSMAQVYAMLRSMIFNFTGSGMNIIPAALDLAFFTWLLLLVQAAQFIKKDQLVILRTNAAVKALFFAACCYLIAKRGLPNGEAFIYYIF